MAARSKERRVLVLGSKKRWATSFPLKVGTLGMGRVRISLRFSAVSKMWEMSSAEREEISRIWRWLNSMAAPASAKGYQKAGAWSRN